MMFPLFLPALKALWFKLGDNIEREERSQYEAVGFKYGVSRVIGYRVEGNETKVS